MKIITLPAIIIFILLNTTIQAQTTNNFSIIEKETEAVVQTQLDAYNDRDVEAFLETYSDSVKVYNYPNELRFQGKAKVRMGYAELFKRAVNLHCKITSRTVFGNRVIDEEKVTGYSQNENDVLYAVAIYTVENGKISEVRFMSK